MTAPGYPFSARDIFGDLRSRLAAEHRRPMNFERLAKMLGRSKSTTYNWFEPQYVVVGVSCRAGVPPRKRLGRSGILCGKEGHISLLTELECALRWRTTEMPRLRRSLKHAPFDDGRQNSAVDGLPSL
jgi:hypothetical protein